jgi:regulator of sigma E protease
MSIFIFLAVLFALVLVHELGHFAVAKWTGMRVDEFGIGFPPKLWGIKKGETEYTLNLFPIGGFVKIRGEDGEESAHTPNSSDPRSFVAKSKWAQAAVLIAGVTMNVLFAWILVTLAFWIGVQTSVSESEASENAALVITNVLKDGPAEKANIMGGSVIKEVTLNGEKLSPLTPTAFSAFVATHGGEPITLTYMRGGDLQIVQIAPLTNILSDKPEQPALGVALAQIDTVSRNIFEASFDSFMYVVYGLRDITVGIVKLAVDAVMMRADFSQVAGPVGIVGLVGEASAYGLTSLLMFTAFISLNLAVINIFPFPALDGGRLLLVAIEAVKGSPIRAQYTAVLNTVGFVLLIILMIAVTWNDIAKL